MCSPGVILVAHRRNDANGSTWFPGFVPHSSWSSWAAMALAPYSFWVILSRFLRRWSIKTILRRYLSSSGTARVIRTMGTKGAGSAAGVGSSLGLGVGAVAGAWASRSLGSCELNSF